MFKELNITKSDNISLTSCEQKHGKQGFTDTIANWKQQYNYDTNICNTSVKRHQKHAAHRKKKY